MHHYVYQHIRNDTGAIFYVGKGVGKRAWHKGKNRSRWWRNVAAKSGGHVVQIVASGLDEELALFAEQELIAKYRALGFNLVNMTIGGDAGNKLSPQAEIRRIDAVRESLRRPETVAKLSAAQKQLWSDPKERAKRLFAISAAAKSPEGRLNASERMKTRWKSEDYKSRVSAAISDAFKNQESRMRKSLASKASAEVRATAVVCIETGQEFKSMSEASAWVASATKFKATPSKICLACKGVRQSAYGFTWKYKGK